jgi:hypothetical protein
MSAGLKNSAAKDCFAPRPLTLTNAPASDQPISKDLLGRCSQHLRKCLQRITKA